MTDSLDDLLDQLDNGDDLDEILDELQPDDLDEVLDKLSRQPPDAENNLMADGRD